MRNPWRTLTAGEMLQTQLAKAETARRWNVVQVEEHITEAACCRVKIQMLDARIARIKAELKAMNTTEDTKE